MKHIVFKTRALSWVLGLSLILSLGDSFAQSHKTSVAKEAASVTQAQAVVPRVIYRSVFRETSLGIEQEKTDWRQANEAVGRFQRGHLDILKAEEKEEKEVSKDKKSEPSSRSEPTHKH